MRRIERDMVHAFSDHQPKSVNHDKIIVHDGGSVSWELHHNRIALLKPSESLLILYDGGVRSATTKSRLNALATAYGLPHVYQKRGVWRWSDDVPFDYPFRMFPAV